MGPVNSYQSPGATSLAKRRNYATYKSPNGPRFAVPMHVSGWTLSQATGLGMTLGAFGVSAGIFALFFFSDIPKVRKDIIQKIPIIGDHFVKEIPPSDNPF